jgi:hypothetical protein
MSKNRPYHQDRMSVKESSNTGFYSQRERQKIPTLEDLSKVQDRKRSLEQYPTIFAGMKFTNTREYSQDSSKEQPSLILSDRIKRARGSLGIKDQTKIPSYLTASVCSVEPDQNFQADFIPQAVTRTREFPKETSKISYREPSTQNAVSQTVANSYFINQNYKRLDLKSFLVNIPGQRTNPKNSFIEKQASLAYPKPPSKLGSGFNTSGFQSQSVREQYVHVKAAKLPATENPSDDMLEDQAISGLDWRRDLPKTQFKPMANKKGAPRKFSTNNPLGVSMNLSSVQRQLKIEIPSARGFNQQLSSGVDMLHGGKKLSINKDFTRTTPYLQPGTDAPAGSAWLPTKSMMSHRDTLANSMLVSLKQTEPKQLNFMKIKGDQPTAKNKQLPKQNK